MILSTFFALEEINKNFISVTTFCIGTVWLLYKIRYVKDEELRGKIETWLEWCKSHVKDPNGIILPSLFTLLSPFLLVAILESKTSNGINATVLPFIAPIVGFFLGQLSITRQKKQERIETNSQIMLAVFGEILYNIRLLESNSEKLGEEYIHISDKKYSLIMLSPLQKTSLESAVINSPEILIKRELFLDARPILFLIDQMNEVIAARQFYLISLRESIRLNGIEPYSSEIKRFALTLRDIEKKLHKLLDKHSKKLRVSQ